MRSRIHLTIIVLLACVLAAISVPSVDAQGDPAASDRSAGSRWAAGDEAIERLRGLSGQSQAAPPFGLEGGVRPLGPGFDDIDQLARELRFDDTLRVDPQGQLVYLDRLAPPEADHIATGATSSSIDPTSAFQLASLPGAAHTVFLDFDGHQTVGTTWNWALDQDVLDSPPFDLDGRPGSFSTQELQLIADSWAVVAEDLAPWNINVTTIEPSFDALSRSSEADPTWGARIVITTDTWAECRCGGQAYPRSFDDAADEPGFVYNRGFVGVSETASHEIGHMLGLAHDGNGSSSYHPGHGIGETSWGPIMGAPFGRSLSQWSLQEFDGATNQGPNANYGAGPDDVAIIGSPTNGNGFGLRPDDHGDSAASATPIDGTGTWSGIIGTRADIDAFSFTTSGGPLDAAVTTQAIGGNLDAALVLRDESGAELIRSDPQDRTDASLTAELAAGSYLLEVDGVGLVGFQSDYGSLGRYTLAATVPPNAQPPVEPEEPPVDPDEVTITARRSRTRHGVVEGDVTASYEADGIVQTFTESTFGDDPDRLRDRLAQRWVFRTEEGSSLDLHVVGSTTDGGDADDGFVLSWSPDGGRTWLDLGHLDGAVDRRWQIEAAYRRTVVRIRDTSRRKGTDSPDTIAVDVLVLVERPG